nr:hypothetical protein [uncultured Roseateles sp.]
MKYLLPGPLAFLRWLLAGLLLCGSLLGPLQAQTPTRSWRPLGPDYGTVLSFAHQPSFEAVVLAGTYFGGLYRSTDWGFSWKAVSVPFSARSVFALAFDPSGIGRVYAGVYQDGVWRSDDSGQTWTRSAVGLTDLDVQALAVDPARTHRVLAATAQAGVFLSQDGAAQWQLIDVLAGVRGRAIVFDARQPLNVYLGTVGQGVYRSVDGGVSWTTLGRNLGTVISLNFDAAGNLYAATEGGVFQLQVGASDWTDLSFNLPKLPIAHVLPHPSVPNFLFAATVYGVYALANWDTKPTWFQWTSSDTRLVGSDSRGLILHVAGQHGSMLMTTDFGAHWIRGDVGIQNAFVGALATLNGPQGWRLLGGTDLGLYALDSGQPWKSVLKRNEAVFDLQTRGQTAYAGAETTGVWKSGDGGDSWALASQGLVPTRINGFSRTVEDKPTLLVASASGLYRSIDDGAQWLPVKLPMVQTVLSVAADPVRGPIVYIGSGAGQVLRSIDGGQSFVNASAGLPAEGINRLVHAPWGRVYALTAGGGLYASSDNGSNWYPSKTGCDAAAVAMVADPQRNWVLYLATAGGGLCKSESAGLQWAPANQGLDNPYVTALWLDAAQPARLIAGSVGKVYLSSDGGVSWKSGGAGLPAAPVTALVGSGQSFFALLNGQGLYRSGDGGASWSPMAAPVAGNAQALTQLPGGRLLLGTPYLGLQASDDGGASWQPANAGMSLFVRSLALDPADANTLYAGSLSGGVFRSRDAAASWSSVGLSDGNVFKVVAPAAGRVLVGTSTGIAASDDGGDSWAQLGQRASYVWSIAADPDDGRRMVLGSVAGQVWAADASGSRWRHVGQGLPPAEVQALTRCADDSLYAAPERSGIYRSALNTLDGWRNAGGTGLGSAQVVSLSCDPRSGLLYAATNGAGVFLSLDRGANWAAINQGLPGTSGSQVIATVLASPTVAWQVWVAVRDGTVYRSDDGGLHWSAAGQGLPGGGISQLSAGGDGTLYASAANTVYRLAGSTWTQAANGLAAGRVTALWAHPKDAGRLLAAVAGVGVFVSTDAGAHWSPSATDAAAAEVTVLGGGATRVFAGTLGTGLAWSDDGGAHFGAVQLAAQIPAVVTGIAVDSGDAARLYLATGGQGVLYSTDGGANWRGSSSGLGSSFLLCLVAHPQRPGVIYAGTTEGVFVSTDSALSWTAINEGLNNRNVTSLVFDSLVPGLLFAGTEGGGIYLYDTR